MQGTTITYQDYIKGIKEKYEESKNTMYHGLLLDPKRSEIRDLCVSMFQKGISQKDESIFRDFFGVEKDDNLKRKIENMDIADFRTMINFMEGKSKLTNKKNLNLLAVLIDFEIRPYIDFINAGKQNKIAPINNPDKKKINQSKDGIYAEEGYVIIDDIKPPATYLIEGQERRSQNFIRKNLRITVATVFFAVLLAVSLYTFKDKLIAPQCMQWQGNVYALLNCNEAKKNNRYNAMALDTAQVKVMRIPCSDTTTFFRNGKPIVWYLKRNNKYECFNHPGYHPEIFKELKPISSGIARKIVEQAAMKKSLLKTADK